VACEAAVTVMVMAAVVAVNPVDVAYAGTIVALVIVDKAARREAAT
jgi:hypothetical protein